MRQVKLTLQQQKKREHPGICTFVLGTLLKQFRCVDPGFSFRACVYNMEASSHMN